MRIYVDIETTSQPEEKLRAIMPAFEAPANYKTAEAIAKAIAEKQAAFIERAALDATTGEIVAIGMRYGADGKACIDTVAPDRTEERMLRNFWDAFGAHVAAGHQFIGFNIARFDVPYLIRRSWIHSLRILPNLYRGRYLNPDIFTDLAEVWSMGSRDEYISLRRLAEALDVGTKNDENSKGFGALLLSNRAEAIAHLENDLRLTEAVANRLLGEPVKKRAPGVMKEYADRITQGEACGI